MIKGTPLRRIAGALVLTAALAAVSGCSANWSTPAATVGDHEISRDELESDVALMRDHPELAAAFQLDVGEGGPVPSTTTAQLLTLRIAEFMLADRYAASDKQLTAEAEQAQRDRVRSELVNVMGSAEAVDALPQEFVNRLLDRFVHSEALLADVPQEEFEQTVADLFGGFTVEVTPRYGTWDAVGYQVVPPVAPGVSGTSPEAGHTVDDGHDHK